MKRYIKTIKKKLLKLKRTRSLDNVSNDPFFSSNTSSDSSQSLTTYKEQVGLETPTTVLHSKPNKKNLIGNYIVNDFVHAFQMMDRDGDGKIGKEDLRILLSKVGGSALNNDDEIISMLSDVDINGDGSISLEELSQYGSALEPPTCHDELRETFNFFDADHDGKITAEELFSVFETIVGDGGCTLEECKRMIKSVDINEDGFVCFEDFCRMMDSQLQI
ncbi:calmodulin-related [Lithospermum erythrorhizon]|uniref:Calmodulin-related n=1 Tax=Lithospermum erythrorhizon TaxID=34254 RepID=A0AAV3S0A0_LITER